MVLDFVTPGAGGSLLGRHRVGHKLKLHLFRLKSSALCGMILTS